MALNIARAGARSGPSVIARLRCLRSLLIGVPPCQEVTEKSPKSKVQYPKSTDVGCFDSLEPWTLENLLGLFFERWAGEAGDDRHVALRLEHVAAGGESAIDHHNPAGHEAGFVAREV